MRVNEAVVAYFKTSQHFFGGPHKKHQSRDSNPGLSNPNQGLASHKAGSITDQYAPKLNSPHNFQYGDPLPISNSIKIQFWKANAETEGYDVPFMCSFYGLCTKNMYKTINTTTSEPTNQLH